VKKASRRAKRHAKESRMRTERMLKEAASRSGPVKISYLPGFGPPTTKKKFPFLATITCPKGTYEVRVHETGMEFVRWIKKED
jgi:hypothetical protein